jgi:hypothetical protein
MVCRVLKAREVRVAHDGLDAERAERVHVLAVPRPGDDAQRGEVRADGARRLERRHRVADGGHEPTRVLRTCVGFTSSVD